MGSKERLRCLVFTIDLVKKGGKHILLLGQLPVLRGNFVRSPVDHFSKKIPNPNSWGFLLFFLSFFAGGHVRKKELM